MHLERLTDAADDRFKEAMALYHASFPPHEQRKAQSQRSILTNDAYHFALLYDESNFVGMLLYWEVQEFIYVEHFCIKPELRNHYYGQKALALLQEQGVPIILEIDPVVDEISQRRKGFYERAGFQENPYAHIHPPYHPERLGHALTVMSHPALLSEHAYMQFKRYLDGVVMDAIML